MSLELVLNQCGRLGQVLLFLEDKDIFSTSRVSKTVKAALDNAAAAAPPQRNLSLEGTETAISFTSIASIFNRHIKMYALDNLIELLPLQSLAREEIKERGLDISKIESYISYAKTHPFPGRITLSLIVFDYETKKIPASGICSLEKALDHLKEDEGNRPSSYTDFYHPQILALILHHPNAVNLPSEKREWARAKKQPIKAEPSES